MEEQMEARERSIMAKLLDPPPVWGEPESSHLDFTSWRFYFLNWMSGTQGQLIVDEMVMAENSLVIVTNDTLEEPIRTRSVNSFPSGSA